MIDAITGLETEPQAEPRTPMYMVVSGNGFAYSIHLSMAAARAKIAWCWQRRHPSYEFLIVET